MQEASETTGSWRLLDLEKRVLFEGPVHVAVESSLISSHGSVESQERLTPKAGDVRLRVC